MIITPRDGPAQPPPANQRIRIASNRVRARLRHAAFTSAPLWLTRGRLAHAHTRRGMVVIHRQIILPNLPDPLAGLTITHLSDMHIGRLTTPAQLPRIVEMCQRLGSDMIAVTGDFIDFSLSVLDAVIASLRQLQAPLGVYLVPGNHDYLDNKAEFLRRIQAAGHHMLLNQTIRIPRHDCHITVAGIDYAHHPRTLANLVHRTLRSGPRQRDLTLLLAHHPDAFDPACRHKVDLTLSGHTHGGQVVLSNSRGKKGSIGLGSLAFRYPRGLYRRGDSYLYVSSGIGSWFPLRVNCPAEIALLTLQSQASSLSEPSHP